MKFIQVKDTGCSFHDSVLLNLDSISWIAKLPDGLCEVECHGNHILVDQCDYQRILTALGIR